MTKKVDIRPNAREIFVCLRRYQIFLRFVKMNSQLLISMGHNQMKIIITYGIH